MSTQHGGVYIWPDTGAGASITNQTFTSYVELGTPGAFSYPSNGLIRVGSPSVANNRRIITFEPNAGGTDLDVLQIDTSNRVLVGNDTTQLRLNGAAGQAIEFYEGGSRTGYILAGNIATTGSLMRLGTGRPDFATVAALAEGVLSADPGSFALQPNSAPAWKESGAGNTGWVTLFKPAYACLYNNDNTPDLNGTGGYVDVTAWTGENCTEDGVTVSTANGTLTVASAGKYLVTYTGTLSAVSWSEPGTAYVRLVQNGAIVPGSERSQIALDGSVLVFAASAIVDASASDVFKVQFKSATVVTGTIQHQGNFSIQRVA